MTSGISSLGTYRFKVAAKNKWGTGDYSNSVSIIAYPVSDPPTAAVITLSGSNVKIAWNKPDVTVN